jgi:caa(3)-type oxidase subunit IV
MHAPTDAEIAAEERRYIQIFVWLGVLTALEIGVTYLPLGKIAIGAMLVLLAGTKAALVGLYYMHLVHEKRTLTWIAVTPAIICVFHILMLVPDLGDVTRLLVSGGAPAAAPAAGH